MNGSYRVALGTLKERFGTEQAIANAWYLAPVNLPTAQVTTQSLRTFYNAVETHLRSLDASGQTVTQDLMIPLISSKQRTDVPTQLEMRKSNATPWTVSSLRESLKDCISVREGAEQMKGGMTHLRAGKPHTSQAAASGSKGNGAVPTKTLLNNVQKHRPSYWICRKPHFSDECTTYDTIEKQKMQIKNLCCVCLKQGHNARDCRNARPCFHCGRNSHHRSLCPVKFKPSGPSLNAGAKPFEAANTTVSTCDAQGHTLSETNHNVLMQTAKVTVQNGHNTCMTRILFDTGASRTFVHKNLANSLHCTPTIHGKISCITRILFDTGASRTFVHKNLANSLHCTPTIHGKISNAGFGALSRTTKTLPRVEFNVLLQDGTFQTLTTDVSDQISCTMQRSPLDIAKYPGLSQLPLAEPLATETSHDPIDILVSSDRYFDFVGLQHLKFSDGLTMLNTKLGFIPSGKLEQGK